MSAPGGKFQDHCLDLPIGDGSPLESPRDNGSRELTPSEQQHETPGLPQLLAVVATLGWESDAGRDAIAIMRRACRREAMQWTRTAGWLTDEGLATVWEQMDRVVRTGRFDEAPGLLRVIVRRAYAGEAAAAQTGLGSPTTRGLIGAIQRCEAGQIAELGAEDSIPAVDEHPTSVAPQWMRTLAAVLAVEGWRWPMPPLHAVMASAAGVARTGRRCRSVLAAHDTGVPPASWSALDLLTYGSGPVASRNHARRGYQCRSICWAPQGCVAISR